MYTNTYGSELCANAVETANHERHRRSFLTTPLDPASSSGAQPPARRPRGRPPKAITVPDGNGPRPRGDRQKIRIAELEAAAEKLSSELRQLEVEKTLLSQRSTFLETYAERRGQDAQRLANQTAQDDVAVAMLPFVGLPRDHTFGAPPPAVYYL